MVFKHLAFFLMAIITTNLWASKLIVSTVDGWEIHEKFLGSDYSIVNSKTNDTIIIKKIDAPVKPEETQSYLENLVKDKAEAPIPWEEAKILNSEMLLWYKGGKPGRLVKVEHLKNKKPHTSLVGVQPLENAHYIIFFSDETDGYKAHESSVMNIIKKVRGL